MCQRLYALFAAIAFRNTNFRDRPRFGFPELRVRAGASRLLELADGPVIGRRFGFPELRVRAGASPLLELADGRGSRPTDHVKNGHGPNGDGYLFTERQRFDKPM